MSEVSPRREVLFTTAHHAIRERAARPGRILARPSRLAAGGHLPGSRQVAHYLHRAALGRPIKCSVWDQPGGGVPAVTYFYHDGANVVAECKESTAGGRPGDLLRYYVHGANGVDEPGGRTAAGRPRRGRKYVIMFPEFQDDNYRLHVN